MQWFRPPSVDRELEVHLLLDTNVINAREKLPCMNQIERWTEARIVRIYMTEASHVEATAGTDARRFHKVLQWAYHIPLPSTPPERTLWLDIAKVLFPDGIKNQNQENDVSVVFTARKYLGILVTLDGASKRQPGGILGNREALGSLGVKVMTDCEARDHILKKIRDRDELARRISAKFGTPLPTWVGTDDGDS